jgi:two-component system sensor kinase FixL
MPSGGRLGLTGRRDEDGLEITVTDTGVGIAPENLGRVMEPLFSTKARGMGLGLALSRLILDKNHGSLRVVSEPGKGSTFTVRLTVAGREGGPHP